MTLTFWFDVHSPWVYLASHRVGAIARRHGAELLWRPLHLPSLLNRIGGVKPMEATPARVRWFKQDILDWAEVQGLPIRYHPNYPLRNSRALRVSLFAADAGRAEIFVKRLTRAYWAEEGDISDLDSLGRWADECGLERAGAMAAAADKVFKQRVEANTTEAIARGIFGVPTVDTGEKLYFGNDRLDLLDRHLSAIRA